MHEVRGLKLGFFALFSRDASMREIRRPKPEMRKKRNLSWSLSAVAPGRTAIAVAVLRRTGRPLRGGLA
jgi:hypothetical protein